MKTNICTVLATFALTALFASLLLNWALLTDRIQPNLDYVSIIKSVEGK